MPSFTKSVSTRVSQHRSQDISDEGYDDLDAWMQAVGAFLVYTATWGLLSAYGSYEKYYETTLMSSTPSTTISWVGTLQVVIVICTMTTVLGVMMLSLAHEYYQILLAQGVCIGVGSATLYVPSARTIGGIIYPIIFSTLQPKIGFSWATRVLGFVTLAELIIAMAIMIPRTKKSKGLHQIRSILDPTAFHDPAFVAFCLAIFLMWVSYWVPFFLLPTFALFKVGASSNIAFYVLVICNASTIPGRYLAVPISNRFGPALTMGGFAMASSIILFGWVGVESVTSTIIWAILIALFMGPLGALYPIIVPHVSPKKELVGTRIGISSAAAAFGTLVGFPITSALNDIQTGTFWKSEVLNGSKPHSNDLLPRHIYVSPRPRLTALQLSASKREHSTLWFISRIQEVCCYVQTKWYGATRKKL
uniref:Riboflavin transporter MCH5 n=2 Tax=Talaromyces marneffei PM1 TaxID=1077442 RepID=A0A093W2K0_TALMA